MYFLFKEGLAKIPMSCQNANRCILDLEYDVFMLSVPEKLKNVMYVIGMF